MQKLTGIPLGVSVLHIAFVCAGVGLLYSTYANHASAQTACNMCNNEEIPPGMECCYSSLDPNDNSGILFDPDEYWCCECGCVYPIDEAEFNLSSGESSSKGKAGRSARYLVPRQIDRPIVDPMIEQQIQQSLETFGRADSN